MKSEAFANKIAREFPDIYNATCFLHYLEYEGSSERISLPVWWGTMQLCDPDYWGCNTALLINYGRKPAWLGWPSSKELFQQLCWEWARFTDFESLVVVVQGSDCFKAPRCYVAVCQPTDDEQRWEIDLQMLQRV